MGLLGHTAIFAITSGLWIGAGGAGILHAQDVKPGTIFKDCNACPEMVVLPVGSFSMGSTKGHQREQPVQNIIMDKPLAAARYETTFEEGMPAIQLVGVPRTSSTGVGAGPPTGHERALCRRSGIYCLASLRRLDIPTVCPPRLNGNMRRVRAHRPSTGGATS